MDPTGITGMSSNPTKFVDFSEKRGGHVSSKVSR